MQKNFLLIVALIGFRMTALSQNLAQSNCEACYQTINAAFAPNMARLFNYTNTTDINESFKSWFFSDDFVKYVNSNSTGLTIPIYGVPLNFSHDENSDWQRRKTIIEQKNLQLDDHFFTQFWSLNPDIGMANEFNRALQSCNENPCQESEGRLVFLKKVDRTENSVVIQFQFTPVEDGQNYPVIEGLEYDRSIFSLNDKKWIGKSIGKTNAIILKRKSGTKWTRSFFSLNFKKGIKGISFFIDGEMTPGFITYNAISGVMIPSCQPYNEKTFTNEGNHNNHLGIFLKTGTKLGDYISGGGDSFEAFYVNEPTAGGQPTQLLQRTLPILSDGRKYKDIQLIRQGANDEQVYNYVQTYIDYYENGVVKPGLTESNQVRVRIYDRSKWVRFSIAGQICSYSAQQIPGELNVNFDATNTALIDLPANCLSAIMVIQKNGILYRVNLLDVKNNTPEVNVHFMITPPEQGKHVYAVKYRS